MQGIKNVLGKFRLSSVKTQRWHRTTYARICVGIDFNQSFLREMKRLITKDYTCVHSFSITSMVPSIVGCAFNTLQLGVSKIQKQIG